MLSLKSENQRQWNFFCFIRYTTGMSRVSFFHINSSTEWGKVSVKRWRFMAATPSLVFMFVSSLIIDCNRFVFLVVIDLFVLMIYYMLLFLLSVTVINIYYFIVKIEWDRTICKSHGMGSADFPMWRFVSPIPYKAPV